MNLKYRIWIASNEEERIFGYGIYQLLRYIRLLGSLNKACQAMKLPYHKASMIIDRCETFFDKKIITRISGGSGGGGSEVSPFGVELMKRYEDFTEAADLELKQLYYQYFDTLDDINERF